MSDVDREPSVLPDWHRTRPKLVAAAKSFLGARTFSPMHWNKKDDRWDKSSTQRYGFKPTLEPFASPSGAAWKMWGRFKDIALGATDDLRVIVVAVTRGFNEDTYLEGDGDEEKGHQIKDLGVALNFSGPFGSPPIGLLRAVEAKRDVAGPGSGKFTRDFGDPAGEVLLPSISYSTRAAIFYNLVPGGTAADVVVGWPNDDSDWQADWGTVCISVHRFIISKKSFLEPFSAGKATGTTDDDPTFWDVDGQTYPSYSNRTFDNDGLFVCARRPASDDRARTLSTSVGAPAGKDTRGILISCGVSMRSSSSENTSAWGAMPNFARMAKVPIFTAAHRSWPRDNPSSDDGDYPFSKDAQVANRDRGHDYYCDHLRGGRSWTKPIGSSLSVSMNAASSDCAMAAAIWRTA